MGFTIQQKLAITRFNNSTKLLQALINAAIL